MKNFKIEFNKDDAKRGKIFTPYTYNMRNSASTQLEINFHELYEGTYSFAKYGMCQFIIKSDDPLKAVELAIKRLKLIFKNGVPNSSKLKYEVSGFKLNEFNKKGLFTPSFWVNTHLQNKFTSDYYYAKKGDILLHDIDGDGWGFWYVVDANGNKLSSRLKGSILVGLLSDGVITIK